MYDGASSHSASKTEEELKVRNIDPIFWPVFSLDLNTVEPVLNLKKIMFKQMIQDFKAVQNFQNMDFEESYWRLGDLFPVRI